MYGGASTSSKDLQSLYILRHHPTTASQEAQSEELISK